MSQPDRNQMLVIDDAALAALREQGMGEDVLAFFAGQMKEHGGAIPVGPVSDFLGAFPEQPPDEPFLRAMIVLDPIRGERESMTLAWREGASIADYMGELPEHITYEVSLNGTLIAEADRALVVPAAGDFLCVVACPGGRVGQVFAMLALVVIAAVVAGPLGAIIGPAIGLSAAVGTAIVSGVIMTVGGFLINSLMAAPAKKTAERAEEKDSPSYGIDGPKPTSEEGVNLPVIYGEHRTSGNRTDFFVENSADGKTQTLYLRYAVCEGPIESISDIELNELPLSNFSDCVVDTRLGHMPERPIPWFNDVVTPQTYNLNLTENTLVRNTVSEVDRVRLDFTFPAGLFKMDKKTGDRQECTVGLYAVVTNLDTGFTVSLNEAAWAASPVVNGYLTLPGAAARMTVRVLGEWGSSPVTSRQVVIQATRPGHDGLEVLFNGEVVVHNVYQRDGQYAPGSVELQVETQRQAIQNPYQGGSLIFTAALTGFAYAMSGAPPQGYNYQFSLPDFCDPVFAEVLTGNKTVITRAERNAFRLSLHSPALPRGRYAVQVRRTSPESTDAAISDKVQLADIVEIQTDQVNLNGTASYALKIRLSDQLNSEPRPTVKVRGRRVAIFDREGQAVDFRWSNNCADVVADILLSGRWNTGISPTRIDWPSLARLRDHCAVNGLAFNGVFEQDSTVWDALQTVLRVARANVALSGLKWSFVIEAPAEPTMLFGQHNIKKGSFENYWMGTEDRANQVEIQFYDEQDRNKRSSVFWTDMDAMARGEPLRSNTINLVGCTNRAQAEREAIFQVNLNRGVRQGARFETYLDALSCAVGDVVYVQHDMPKWGWAGRIASVRWPEVLLDMSLDGVNPGEWRMLVHYGAMLLGGAIVTGVSGRQVRVPGSFLQARRIRINGVDYRADDAVLAGPETVFVLDRQPSGVTENVTVAEMWQIDHMREAAIEQPQEGDESVRVNLASWGGFQPPPAGAQIMVGRVGKFRKPFRVMRLGRRTDHTMQVDCAEYNAEVYSTSVISVPPNYSELGGTPKQVQSLAASQRQELTGSGWRYFGDWSWVRPLSDQRRYAGAHVFLRLNDGNWQHMASPLDPAQSFSVEVAPGQVAALKVQAFYSNGETAPWDKAPVAMFSPSEVGRLPDPPLNLQAQGGIRLISASWDLPNDPTVKSIEVWESDQVDRLTSYKVDEGYKTFFVRNGIMPLETRRYWVRSVSYSNTKSDWVGPAVAQARELVASDISNGIIDTAKFAQGIQPVLIIENTATLPTREDEVAVSKADKLVYRSVRGQDGGLRWVAEVPAALIIGQLTDEQIQGLAAAKLTGEITETQIEDGAISTPKLQAGAVTAGKIDAAAVTTEKLAVGSSNLIWNSCLTSSRQGWIFYGANGYSGAGLLGGSASRNGLSDWSLRDSGSGYVNAPQIAFAPGWQMGAVWQPDPAIQGVPIVPGRRIAAAAMLASHRCDALVRLTFVAANGAFIEEHDSSRLAANTALGGRELFGYARRTVHAIAPTNAARAVLVIVGEGIGQSDPYVFFTQTMLGEIPINATEVGAWSAGGVTRVDGAAIETGTITSLQVNTQQLFSDTATFNNLRAGIASFGGLRATEIAANEIRAVHLASETLITQTAQIGDLTVSRLKIQAGAVSTSTYYESYYDITSNHPNPGNHWGEDGYNLYHLATVSFEIVPGDNPGVSVMVSGNHSISAQPMVTTEPQGGS